MPDRQPRLQGVASTADGVVLVRVVYDGLRNKPMDTVEMTPEEAVTYATRILNAVERVRERRASRKVSP